MGEIGAHVWWALAALVVTIIASVAARLIILRGISRSEPPSYRVRQFARATSMLVLVFGIVVALYLAKVDVSPLLGAAGIGGIALAIASQDILQNMLAGFLIQTRRPFKVGEQIQTGELEGTVTDIDFRAIHMRTYDGLDVIIPSADVLRNPIINNTRTPLRRTRLDVGVAYDTDLDLAQRVLVDAVTGVDGVSRLHAPSALAHEFADSSINFAVLYWHKADIRTTWQVRSRAVLAIKAALDEAGITIPFPQRVLWHATPEE